MTRQPDKLSLDNFKRWMKEQEKSDSVEPRTWHKAFVGTQVESKLPAKRLVLKITSEEGDVEELATDFAEHGGTVADADGKMFLIEVDSGTFYLHRCYVKRS